MLALRCLNNAIKLDENHPRVHEQVVYFRGVVDSMPSVAPKVAEVLRTQFKAAGEPMGMGCYIEQFAAKHRGSPRHALSVIAAKRMSGKDKNECDRGVIGLLDMQGVSFEDAMEMLNRLRSWRSSVVSEFKKAAQAKWPEVTRLA